VVSVCTRRASAAVALLAAYSCTKASTALSSRMMLMMMASVQSPSSAESTVATSRIKMIGLLN
jgi:hypothetical protein